VTRQRLSRNLGLDIVRGCCLVLMTVDHLPQNVFSRFSNTRFGPFGFFTAASAFVFLSGLVSARVYGSTFAELGTRATWRRALIRIAQLYAVNTAILMLLLTGIYLGVLSGPFWQQEFSLFYQEPMTAVLQGLLLLYRPGYTDILPMYLLFLLLVTPTLATIRASHGLLAMALSGSLWACAQTLTWSDSFNPFGYQLLFVTGLVIGSRTDLQFLRQTELAKRLAWASLAVVLILMASRFALGVNRHFVDNITSWSWLTHLENNGPLRVLNFALFAFIIAYWWPTLFASVRDQRLVWWMAQLGRRSLAVFTWSVVATYISIALMPAHPSRMWGLLDMLLTLSSLAIPVALLAQVQRRRQAESAIAR